jgi:O-antigen ligase
MTTGAREDFMGLGSRIHHLADVAVGPAYELPRFRAALVGLIMLSGMLAGYLIPRGGQGLLTLLVAVAVGGAVSFLIGLRRPDLGPVVILFTAAFVPLSLPTGTESRLVASLLLTLLCVLTVLLRAATGRAAGGAKQLLASPSPVYRPLLAFVVVTVLSLPWSIIMRDPLVPINRSNVIVGIASTVVMVALPAAFWLVADQVRSLKTLKVMVAIMLAAGCLGAISQYGFAKLPVNTGGLFTMWIIILASGLGLFHRGLPRRARLLVLGLAAIWVYWGFVLHISWVAGWFGGLLGLALLLVLRSRKLALVAGLIFLAVIVVNHNYYVDNVLTSEDNESGVTRMSAWEANWRVTGKHLLLGTGPAGYAAYYMTYFPTDAMATHNNLVDILAETGVVGLAICVWFFVALCRLGYRVWRRVSGHGDFAEALAAAIFAGAICSFVMMAFGDWLFPFAYTQTIAGYDYAVYAWLFMGAIPVLDRLTRREDRTPIRTSGATQDA